MSRTTSRPTADPMIALFAATALMSGLLVSSDAEAQAVDIALIKDINLTTADALTKNSYQYGFAELNGAFYFVADAGSTGQELWRSDGTPGGTSMLNMGATLRNHSLRELELNSLISAATKR